MKRGPRDVVLVAGSALLARLALLATLALGAAALAHADFVVFAYLLGVASAVQVMVDPTATAGFLVATAEDGRVGRGRLDACLRYQATLSAPVLLAPAAIALATTGEVRWALVAVALGGLAAVETLGRLARVTWQVVGDFGRYARVDQAIGLGRAAAALTLPAGLGWTGFGAVCAASAAVQLVLLRRAASAAVAGAGPHGLRALLGAVWPYTASSLISSLYSQVPTVLVGLLGSVPAGAVYSIATRLTQPTELVPAALAGVGLPRLRRARGAELTRVFRTQLLTGIGLGVLVMAGTIAVAPWVLPLLGTPAAGALTVVVLLACALPCKFASYQLVALAIATGRIRSRLACSAVVGVVSVCASVVAVRIDVVAVAAVALGCELLLVLLLARLGWRTAVHPRPRPVAA